MVVTKKVFAKLYWICKYRSISTTLLKKVYLKIKSTSGDGSLMHLEYRLEREK